MRLLLATLLIVAAAGCKYDRSFMTIDSDSGVPFMGLQLSVDARDAERPKRPSVDVPNTLSESVATANEVTTDRDSEEPVWIPTSLALRDTARESSAATGTDSGPIAAIARRLAAF